MNQCEKCVILFAAKKGKKSHPLKFKVGLGKVIRGVRYVFHVFCVVSAAPFFLL